MIDLADKDMASKSVSRSLLSRILSCKGEIQSSREMIAEAHSKGVVTQIHYYDQVFLLWAQADLYVAEKKWDEAWMVFEKLVSMTGEKSFRWFSRQAYVDWAEALIARGEPEDITQARKMLQESLEDFKDMGADGFVNMIEDRLEAIG
jgi:tetratricopeptide (TPR) repeat protein